MEYFVHPNDYSIERNLQDYKGQAVVMTNDGDIILRLDGERWNDAKIHFVMTRINHFYGKGHEDGMKQKAHEIKAALYL